MINLNEFGRKIKKLRLDKKESLRTASSNIGISHTYLDSLEKGYDPRTKKERKPTSDVVLKIAEYYDYPFLKLMQLLGMYMKELDDEQLEELTNNFSEYVSNTKTDFGISEDEIKKQSLDLAIALRNETRSRKTKVKNELLNLLKQDLSYSQVLYLLNSLEFFEDNSHEEVLFVALLLQQLNSNRSSKDIDVYNDLKNEFNEFLQSYLNIKQGD